MTAPETHPDWCGRGTHCTAYTLDDSLEPLHRSAPLTYRGTGHEGAQYRMCLEDGPDGLFPPAVRVEQYVSDAFVPVTGTWWLGGEEPIDYVVLELDEAAAVASMLVVLVAKADPRYTPRSPR